MSTAEFSKRDAWAVGLLFAVAVIFAVGLMVALPIIARLDPVDGNVNSHRIRELFCKPRIDQKIECLHECALQAGEGYKARSCEQLPSSNPTEADQQRLESTLYEKSPCAAKCQTNWKTHSLWCKKGLETAKLEAVDACIFEGATMALYDWKEERCRRMCRDYRPGDALYMSSEDVCTVSCMVASMVESPSADDLRQLVRQFRTEPDVRIKQYLAKFAEPPVPGAFEAIRRDCRLANVRATYDVPLEEKRKKEQAFKRCVLERLEALPRR